jgi:hypothetical protein
LKSGIQPPQILENPHDGEIISAERTSQSPQTSTLEQPNATANDADRPKRSRETRRAKEKVERLYQNSKDSAEAGSGNTFSQFNQVLRARPVRRCNHAAPWLICCSKHSLVLIGHFRNESVIQGHNITATVTSVLGASLLTLRNEHFALPPIISRVRHTRPQLDEKVEPQGGQGSSQIHKIQLKESTDTFWGSGSRLLHFCERRHYAVPRRRLLSLAQRTSH